MIHSKNTHIRKHTYTHFHNHTLTRTPHIAHLLPVALLGTCMHARYTHTWAHMGTHGRQLRTHAHTRPPQQVNDGLLLDEKLADYQAAFAAADADGSGDISADELAVVLQRLGWPRASDTDALLALMKRCARLRCVCACVHIGMSVKVHARVRSSSHEAIADRPFRRW